MEEKEKYIPATLIECFEIVRQEVKPEDWEQLKNRPDGEFHGWDHHLGWGIYLRNRFLHPRHSPIRNKFRQFFPFFDADPISSLMFKLLWMHAAGKALDATIFKATMDKNPVFNLFLTKREIQLSQIEDLLGKPTD